MNVTNIMDKKLVFATTESSFLVVDDINVIDDIFYLYAREYGNEELYKVKKNAVTFGTLVDTINRHGLDDGKHFKVKDLIEERITVLKDLVDGGFESYIYVITNIHSLRSETMGTVSFSHTVK